MIRVVLVDDQELIRAGLRLVIGAEEDLDICGEAGDGTEALELLASLEPQPDVILMDIRMRPMDGIEATRRIAAVSGPPVLVLTTFDDDDVLAGALDAGASGFVLKESPADDLIRAIRLVAAGGAWLDPAVTPRVLASYRSSSLHTTGGPIEALSDRENAVLRLIAVGANNTEIAQQLGVSMPTVKSHVGRIFTKLGVRDRAAAIVYAFDHGLVAPDPPG